MMNKKIIILVLCLAVMTVVLGCGKKEVKMIVEDNIQEVSQEQNNEKIEEQKEQKEDIEKIPTSTDEIDISDWQIYRNKEYGFEVKYPRAWILKDPGNAYKDYPITENKSRTLLRIENHEIETYISKGDLHVGVGIYKSDKPLKNWFQSRKCYKTDKEKIYDIMSYVEKINPLFKKEDIIMSTEYNGILGKEKIITHLIGCKKICSSEGWPTTSKDVYLKKNNFVYYISTTFATEDHDEYLPIAEKIFSTFKFIN